MSKVLFVIPRLDYTGASRLLTLLAAGLPAGHGRVCVLGGPSPWCEELGAAGVDVDVLDWRWDVNLRPLLSLRSRIGKERPDIVHAWGFAAAWALVLSGCRLPGNLLLSAALPPKRRLSFAESWLLRHCGRVVAMGEAESAAYQRLGVSARRDLPGSAGNPAASGHSRARPAAGIAGCGAASCCW